MPISVRRNLTAVFAVALTTVLTASLAATATPEVPAARAAQAEQLPFDVDTSNQAGWWRPLDTFDGTTYFAFNAPAARGDQHEVHIAARGDDGDWTTGCLRTAAGDCVTYGDDIGHNQPSIVVDGEGHVHAFVSMHNHPWRYYRTTTPGDVTSLVEAAAELPDQDMRFTYPVTVRGADGDAYVLVRADRDAERIRDGRLYRYDVNTRSWSRAAVVAAAREHAFYPDDLAVDADGRVHILFEWGPWPSTALRHLGSYVVYDPADGSFSDVAGDAVDVPVSPDAGSPVVYQPFVGEETIRSEYPAVQTAKLALDGNSSQLHGIAYRYRSEPTGSTFSGFDVRYASWNGSSWDRETVADHREAGPGVETSATIDITHAGPVTRIYFVAQAGTCSGIRSQVVRAERRRNDTGWTFVTDGVPQPGLQRLRALSSPSGTDTLYVTAPVAERDRGRLWHLTIPRVGVTPDGEGFAAVARRLLGRDTDGVNVALGAPVTVSSVLRAGAEGENAVDGLCTDASRWISAQDDPEPTITIDLEQSYPVDQVRVHSGYHAAPVPATDVLRDFTVELRDGGRWHEVARVEGNTSMSLSVDAGGRRADQVRLVITDPSGSPVDVARVFEIDVISGS